MPNTSYWLKRLKDGFAARYPGRKHQLKLPSGISFVTDGSGVRVNLSRKAVEEGNMQSDAAAFEAWALALHGYADANPVELRWDGAIAGRHAWRFRLRANEFARICRTWFHLERAIPPAFEDNVPYLLNVESRPRTGLVEPFATHLRERQLEDVIARDPNVSARFKRTFGLDTLGQQMPVGVFKRVVSEATGVSPSKSAAIDLWGIGGQVLKLFELKRFPSEKRGAKPFGIVSELFLYSLLMDALQRKRLKFAPDDDSAAYRKIEETREIEAWLLAPVLHPLIEYGDAPVLDLLNDALRKARMSITFHRAHLHEDGTFVKEESAGSARRFAV